MPKPFFSFAVAQQVLLLFTDGISNLHPLFIFFRLCNLYSLSQLGFIFISNIFFCLCMQLFPQFFIFFLFSLNPRGPEPSKCFYSPTPSSLSFPPFPLPPLFPRPHLGLQPPLVERAGLKAPTSSVIPFYILCRVAALCHGCTREITLVGGWANSRLAPTSAGFAPYLFSVVTMCTPLWLQRFLMLNCCHARGLPLLF